MLLLSKNIFRFFSHYINNRRPEDFIKVISFVHFIVLFPSLKFLAFLLFLYCISVRKRCKSISSMFVWISFTCMHVTTKAGFYFGQQASWTNILFYNEKIIECHIRGRIQRTISTKAPHVITLSLSKQTVGIV